MAAGKESLMMSPMAGYTDAGFRQLCAECGCGVVVTEMVSAMALKQRSKATFEMLQDEFCGQGDAVRRVQLFGHDPEVFKEIVTFDEIQKFDAIDLNMGCPMPKIVRNGEGCALMQNLPLASEIIRTVVKCSGKPVSVKFRKGFKEESASEFAKMCEDSGANSLTIHGRTREQMYAGRADWSAIKRAVESVAIPVFANGDIKSKPDAEAAVKQTGAFGVAVGRAALGRPQLFAELSGQNCTVNIKDLVLRHIEILQRAFREERVLSEMKKHYVWYLKGIKKSKAFLEELFGIRSIKKQKEAIEDFLGSIDN